MRFLALVCLLSVVLTVVLCDGTLDENKEQQDELSPLIDQDDREKEHDKRTILGLHHKGPHGWAKHVRVRGNHKYVVGFGPVDLKYVPVVKPIVLKSYNNRFRFRAKPQWKPRPIVPSKPVLQSGWTPILTPAHVPAPPHVDVLPWQSEGWTKPGIQQTSKPEIKPVVHVDQVQHGDHLHHHGDHLHHHVHHTDHIHHTDHLHLTPVNVVKPVVLKPVIPDHVHEISHVQHGHHIDQLDTIKPVVQQPPQIIYYNPLVPIQKPQLPVLPLGAHFPSPVLTPTHFHKVPLVPKVPIVPQYPIWPHVTKLYPQVPTVLQPQVPIVHQYPQVHHQPQIPVVHQQIPQVPVLHQQLPHPSVVHHHVPQVFHQQIPQVVHQQIPQVPIVQHQIPQVIHQQVPQVVHQQIPQVIHQQVPQVVQQQIPQVIHQQVPQVVQQQIPQVFQHQTPVIHQIPQPQVPSIHQVPNVVQQEPALPDPAQPPLFNPVQPTQSPPIHPVFPFNYQPIPPNFANPSLQSIQTDYQQLDQTQQQYDYQTEQNQQQQYDYQTTQHQQQYDYQTEQHQQQQYDYQLQQQQQQQEAEYQQNQAAGQTIEYHGSQAHLINPIPNYVPDNYEQDVEGHPQDARNYLHQPHFHNPANPEDPINDPNHTAQHPEEALNAIHPGHSDLQIPEYLPHHPNYHPQDYNQNAFAFPDTSIQK